MLPSVRPVTGGASEVEETTGATVATRDIIAPFGGGLGLAPRMSNRSGLGGARLLTVSEVAADMRVSKMTVYRLIKAGQLAAIRVGKNYRIRESDVRRFLSDRSVNVERR